VIIRQATEADEALVTAINREAYAEYEPVLGGLPAPATECYGPRLRDGQVWLLDDAGALVIERHPDHAMIYSVALRPSRRGERLGTKLLDAAERLTASWGLPELRLYTHARMTRNIAIYTRRGFRETSRGPHPTRPGFTVVNMAKPIATAESELRRLIDVMARLRAPDGCPWDQVQDFDTIAPYTIEEAYEVADAIARRDWEALPDELGDLLFQVIYHARMAEERGWFAFADVARTITDKMIRRHPHVFAGSEAVAWEAHKTAERAARGGRGTLAGVPVALPALTRAAKLTSRAARVGFDWPDAAAVLDKLAEETAELQAELADAKPERLADEVGDMLFVLANLARKLGLDPERCLHDANAKFTRRFEAVEASLAADGVTPAEAGLERMEEAWQAVKRNERGA
jgi:ATP diphosphatase